jgi:RNA polymerase sigma-70 factor (ECF subfamily)
MKAERQRKSIDSFFKKEYNKLVNYVRKNIQELYFNVPPEDIIQDVALNMLSKLDVDLQIENLAAYIYRSLKNRIIDEKRKTKNNMHVEYFEQSKKLNTEVNSILDEANDESATINEIDSGRLYEAISNLKPEEQEIVISTEFEGKSFSELSEDWDVPIGTLLSRKHRALAKLYKILTTTENKHLKINNNGNERKLSRKKVLSS